MASLWRCMRKGLLCSFWMDCFAGVLCEFTSIRLIIRRSKFCLHFLYSKLTTTTSESFLFVSVNSPSFCALAVRFPSTTSTKWVQHWICGIESSQKGWILTLAGRISNASANGYIRKALVLKASTFGICSRVHLQYPLGWAVPFPTRKSS